MTSIGAPAAWLTEIRMQEAGGDSYWAEEVLPHRETGDGFRNARPLYLHPAPLIHYLEWHESASEAAELEQRGIDAAFQTLEAAELALIKLRDALRGNDAAVLNVCERRATEALLRHRTALTAVLGPATP
jgi:hypothetical protein